MSNMAQKSYIKTERDAELDALLAEIATEVLEECRKTLMMSFRFLDAALWHMPYKTLMTGFSLATNGEVLGFHPDKVIDRFRSDPNEMIRDYLHLIFHCIFQHPFERDHDDRIAWDLACDISVEATIIELCGNRYPSSLDAKRMEYVNRFKKQAGNLVPHALYRLIYLGDAGQVSEFRKSIPHQEYMDIISLFHRDSHAPWATNEGEPEQPADEDPVDVPDAERAEKQFGDDKGSGNSGTSQGEDEQTAPEEDANEVPGEGQEGDNTEEGENSDKDPEEGDEDDTTYENGEGKGADEETDVAPDDLLDEWKDIAKQIQADLESFSKMQGEGAEGLMNNLAIANRKPANYTEFLKRFATMAEDMCVNDDEFDYIFYTFGLDHYGNMPLIEPLEYKETNRVREFVIALDTSGSCSGELIKTFVTRTYDVLKQTQGFGEEVNVHIVQVDNQIQSDTKITNVAELEQYRDNFWVKGYGGTDFRPLFHYVDQLVEKGEFEDLRGLIYFTDGLGTFPAQAPKYETAFVFVDDGTQSVHVPPWAMRVQMTEDEILED